MNTSKTLLAILVEYLPENGGWPHATTSIGQDWDRELMFYGRRCVRTGIILDDLAIDHRKRFDTGVKITREQYEAALAASKEPLTGTGVDGWIDWPGGECPVDRDALVEVKYRNGTVKPPEPARFYIWTNGYGSCRTTDADIIAYRLHQPQEAEQAKADDEADLNDCIGQTPAPVWNGDGLPPVGVEVQFSYRVKLVSKSWENCIVTAIGEENLIIKRFDGEQWNEECKRIGAIIFRPINTERDELAAIIEKSWNKNAGFVDAITLTAADLIDAGYRKQQLFWPVYSHRLHLKSFQVIIL